MPMGVSGPPACKGDSHMTPPPKALKALVTPPFLFQNFHLFAPSLSSSCRHKCCPQAPSLRHPSQPHPRTAAPRHPPFLPTEPSHARKVMGVPPPSHSLSVFSRTDKICKGQMTSRSFHTTGRNTEKALTKHLYSTDFMLAAVLSIY